MNIKKIIVGAGAAALMVGNMILPAFAATSVSNGSFENGSNPGVFTTVSAGQTNITDWNVVSGTVDYIGTYWQASNGTRSIDMDGNDAGTISQTLATTPGATYTVTFDMSGNPDGGPVVKTMDVSAGTTTQSFSFDTTGISKTAMGWVGKSFTFTTTSANTTLTFASTTPGFYGAALDNVAITQTLPGTKEECKNGGWQTFGVFKNQGDCVSFVATQGRNLPANQ